MLTRALPGTGSAADARRPAAGAACELAARRRQARARSRADGRARARLARCPRTRQRPLPDELLGDEGLRRRRLPPRRRPDADLPRAFRRRRGADGLDERRPPLRRLRPGRPRPPTLRALDIAHELRERDACGLELEPRHAGDRPHGRRADDLPEGMVRRLARCPRRVPAARRGAGDQDRAGDRAHAARQRDRRRGDGARPGRAPARHDRAQAAAEWQGFVHGEGTGWKGQVELALPFSLVWSGPSISTFTATTDDPIVAGRADAVRDLGLRGRLLGRPHQEPLPRRAHRALRGPARRARAGLRRRRRVLPAGREPRRARPPGPGWNRGRRLPRPAVPSDLPRDRRPRARAAVRAPGRRRRDPGRHGAGDRAGDLLGGWRRSAPRGQLPDHRRRRGEALSFPDGVLEI